MSKIAIVRKIKSPLLRLLYWIREREKIRLAREAGKAAPWTDDEILQSYRFCNVRRMDDKVSKWLLDHWYGPHFNHPNMLYACAFARFINRPESLSLITDDVFVKFKGLFSWSIDWERVKTILRKHRDNGNTVFNGAYMVRGNDGMDKIECVVDYYVKPLREMSKLFDPFHMETTWTNICGSYGMGSFMAGQIVADLRWAFANNWADEAKVWAPMGPGSKRGMNRVHGRDKDAPLSQKEFENELADLTVVLTDADPDILGRLEAIDLQNCLCEFDKHERTLFEDRRPKQLYRGGK